jgi:hypothetical protein
MATMTTSPEAGRSSAPALRSDDATAKVIGAVVLGLASATAIDAVFSRPKPRPVPAPKPVRSAESRGLHGTAALLSLSVLADSAIEHYRGGFKNPGMYTPLVASGLGVAAGLGGAIGVGSAKRRGAIYGLAGAVGAAGLAFHLYDLLKRPGRLNALNLFYAAPVGAPAALTLAGLYGLAGGALERQPRDTPPRLLGLPAGRVLGLLTSFGLMGTVGEAGLMHYRGSFQNPLMVLPVSLPPVAAALTAQAALEPTGDKPRPWTKTWLAITAVLGFGGVGLHAYGVSRAMGGWKNWTQNLIDGPPLPAPPSFAALSLAGLVALSLRERELG